MQLDQQFQELIADPRLGRVTEALKRSNDIFNIIDPTENQHSDILKWLFDPREGHGQGDAILKDFLTAAYGNSYENVHSNREFFEIWTPSRIARTGFHSVICAREYSLPSGKRLDLLLVDTVNKIIVVVENKHGARLGAQQLEGYYDEVSTLRRRPAFSEFSTAHIVLDRNYGGAQEEDRNRTTPWNRWAFLDYQWLEAGARRAELQLKRGNQSAGLVIAYCQKQSDYVAPEEQEVDDTLADLAREYRPVISRLHEALQTKVVALTPGSLNSLDGELWIFANHHPELVERLQAKAELAFIESRFRAYHPNKKLETRFGKGRFWLFDESWYCFFAEHALRWPVCIHIWEMRQTTDGEPKFAMGIQYRPLSVADERKSQMRQALAREFPELQKGRQNASFRLLGKTPNVAEQELAPRAQELYVRLASALAPIVSDS